MSQIKNKKQEFVEGDGILSDPKSRRTFLKYLGGSLAISGLASCSIRKPTMHVTPYVREEEGYIAGEPDLYATTYVRNEISENVLVKTFEGRPTKILPNEKSSFSKGSSTHAQASIIDLYDPDRLKYSYVNNLKISQENIRNYIKDELLVKLKNEKTLIIHGNITSAIELELMKKIQSRYKKLSLIKLSGEGLENERKALENLTGKRLLINYDFSKADRIISFDSDFLGKECKSTKDTFEYSKKRDIEKSKNISRHYHFETNLSISGSKADERFNENLETIELSIVYLANSLDLKNYIDKKSLSNLNKIDSKLKNKLDVMIKDIKRNKNKTLFLCGKNYPIWCHELTILLNNQIGANENTIKHSNPEWLNLNSNFYSSVFQLEELKKNKNNYQNIIVLGENPIYLFKNDPYIKKIFENAKLKIHYTDIINETSEISDVLISKTHYLEDWNININTNGSIETVQPVLDKLYESISLSGLLNLLLNIDEDNYNNFLVSLNKLTGKTNKEKIISTGFIKRSKQIKSIIFKGKLSKIQLTKSGSKIFFAEDYKIGYGENINNPWLQELPDPITKLTWDNALLINDKEAKENKIVIGDVIKLQLSGNEYIELPALPIPGIKTKQYFINIGYGQKIKGKIGNSVGFSVLEKKLISSNYREVENITKTGKVYPLAKTQEAYSQENRDLSKRTTIKEYKTNKDIFHNSEHPPLISLWKEHKYQEGNQWGMLIDLNKCTGCNTCVIACQSENNIPVVGKDQVLVGREMHWIRIDRYIEEDEEDNIISSQQPIACMHCELAPCEQVCPVNATVHDDEGLNVMVYNRCIGTRYCANNCPYKVRRFNYFDWHQRNPHAEINKDKEHIFDHPKRPSKTYRMQFNPDVTVRMRGIMEKCTFCIHRIQDKKIKAKNLNKSIEKLNLKTACQESCSANAIIFGDINNENSEVSKLRRKTHRNYALLEQLNIKPRTLFLAEIKNPNPKLHTPKENKNEVKHH